MQKLSIIPVDLLQQYRNHVTPQLQVLFDELKDGELSTTTFSFYTSVSTVYSSKIEGEDIELDSYIKHKRFGIAFQPDYTKKIDDLYNAYIFTQEHELGKKNILKAHTILTKHLLTKQQQGMHRAQNMYIITPEGSFEYVAAAPHHVEKLMERFYNDIDVLLNEKMSIEDVFFFAAMIHLLFVKIHPFNDGNGRTARLLEKWFLTQKLGTRARFIQSEKYYYQQHQTYYNNLRALGLEFQSLDYSKALPFLLMLPQSLTMRS